MGKTVVEAYPFRGEASLRLPAPCSLAGASRFINENESIAAAAGVVVERALAVSAAARCAEEVAVHSAVRSLPLPCCMPYSSGLLKSSAVCCERVERVAALVSVCRCTCVSACVGTCLVNGE